MEGYGNENPGAFQSTRPLRGATVEPKAVTASKLAFQPTRPLRGATRWSTAPKAKAVFQPTRPLRGATITSILIQSWYNISTHAPLAGRDKVFGDSSGQPVEFQPTRPLRGATTHQNFIAIVSSNFNPRAPCGARREWYLPRYDRRNFNPRAPCGARLKDDGTMDFAELFQPTRPLRGATTDFLKVFTFWGISTHAPLAGRDSKSVQITMHIFAITDKFQMLLHRMPPVRAFCSFLMQESHADFGCEPPK